MIAKVNGSRINYEVYGQGRRLLLLHGWGVDLHTFDKVVPALSQNFQLILPDLPGFGLSSRLNDAWGISDFAQTIKKFLDVLEIKEVNVLGHSFGGSIALVLTQFHPKIQKLIIVDSAGIREKNWLLHLKIAFFKTLKLGVPIPYREALRKIIGSDDYRLAGPLRQTFIRIVNEDLQHLLPKINQPTLIIWGQDDKITPLQEGLTINKLIKTSNMVVYENCDHFPHLEKSERFIKDVLGFLKN